MRVTLLLSIAIFGAAPAAAQEDMPKQRFIQVLGSGRVMTLPDTAVLQFWVSGEGVMSDDAARALAAKLKTITEGARGFLAGKATLSNSEFVLVEVRSPACERAK